MAAYVIAEIQVTNPERYETYRMQVPATLEQYGGTYIARGGAIDAIEGETAGRIIILQFDDVAAAKRWYNSPEYQSIVGLRQANSTGRLTLVEGV
jgi:uncharacterized protein (DUF1330 family)